MKKIRICSIDDNYISYLREFDDKDIKTKALNGWVKDGSKWYNISYKENWIYFLSISDELRQISRKNYGILN